MLKPYENKIIQIQEEITEIGEEIIHANKITLSALKENDVTMLKEINLSVKKLTVRSNDIDNLIVKTLALYSPEAKYLREMVSYLKITNELIRAASYTKEFAKTFKKSFSDDIQKDSILEYTIPLLKASNLALSTSIEMIKQEDDKVLEESMQKVLVEDSKTDDLYAMIEKNILKLIKRDIELSKDYFEILSSLRTIQKISGRATSIAHLVVFAEIGGEIE